MPYPFTEEQRRLRETLRTFALQEVIPGAAERDRSAAYPAHLVTRLAELGLMGITIPEEYGGLGLDTPTQLVAVEEVAYGDAALASIYTGHYLGMEGLLLFGTSEQKRRLLTPLARGEELAAFALTEPDAGSDIASIRTEAVRDGDRWRLRGSKVFISNAREAGLLVVFAKTRRDAGIEGIAAFAVRSDAAGISYSEPQDKLGIRSAPTYEVRLDDVAVANDALIGDRRRADRARGAQPSEDRHRCDGQRHRDARAPARRRLRGRAPAVRSADPRLPGRAAPARGDGRRRRDGTTRGVPCGGGQGRR